MKMVIKDRDDCFFCDSKPETIEHLFWYKKGLLRTMLDRAHRLSSSWTHFSDECDRLKTVFSRLKYPKHLVNSTIRSFVDSKVCDQQQPLSPSQETDDTCRVVLPFKTKSQQIL